MATILIHGGAGTIEEGDRQAYETGLRAARDAGFAALVEGADALSAALAALPAGSYVVSMSASPIAAPLRSETATCPSAVGSCPADRRCQRSSPSSATASRRRCCGLRAPGTAACTIASLSGAAARTDAPMEVVETVVANLLHNAVQHGAQGTIRIGAADDRVTVSSPANGAAAVGGFGLGLEVVRRLCERLGGAMQVSEADGRFAVSVEFTGAKP